MFADPNTVVDAAQLFYEVYEMSTLIHMSMIARLGCCTLSSIVVLAAFFVSLFGGFNFLQTDSPTLPLPPLPMPDTCGIYDTVEEALCTL